MDLLYVLGRVLMSEAGRRDGTVWIIGLQMFARYSILNLSITGIAAKNESPLKYLKGLYLF